MSQFLIPHSIQIRSSSVSYLLNHIYLTQKSNDKTCFISFHSETCGIVNRKLFGYFGRQKLKVIFGTFKRNIIYDVRRYFIKPCSVLLIILTVTVFYPEFISIYYYKAYTQIRIAYVFFYSVYLRILRFRL